MPPATKACSAGVHSLETASSASLCIPADLCSMSIANMLAPNISSMGKSRNRAGMDVR